MIPDIIDGRQGADRIGNIIGTVSKRDKASGHDLKCAKESLCLGIVAGGLVVHVLDNFRLLADILVHTMESLLLELLEHGQRFGLCVIKRDQTTVCGTFSFSIGIARLSVLALTDRFHFHVLRGLSVRREEADVEAMVPAEGLVILDLTAEVNLEEEVAKQEDDRGDAKGDTEDTPNVHLGETEAWRTLEDDVENVDEDGDRK